MESLPPCFRHVALTWCHLLSGPGPVAAPRHLRAALSVRHAPQRACRCQDQTHRVGASTTWPLAALGWPAPGTGVPVTAGHGYGPAVALRAYALCRAPWALGGEKGGAGWGGCFVLALCWALGPDDAAPRPARGAQGTRPATGPPRRGARRPLRWGEASTPWRSARASWARPSGRLVCV